MRQRREFSQAGIIDAYKALGAILQDVLLACEQRERERERERGRERERDGIASGMLYVSLSLSRYLSFSLSLFLSISLSLYLSISLSLYLSISSSISLSLSINAESAPGSAEAGPSDFPNRHPIANGGAGSRAGANRWHASCVGRQYCQVA